VAQVDIAGTRQVVPKKGLSLGERELARELGISYAPSLIFFGTDGEEIFRAEGYLRPFHIAAALDYVAGSAWRTEPSFQRFIQKRADELRAAGHQVNIWE
jgi:thioredoxin-related protein